MNMETKHKEAYYRQKAHAKARDIEFNLTINEWFEFWGDDLARRGNTSGRLVMGRYPAKWYRPCSGHIANIIGVPPT